MFLSSKHKLIKSTRPKTTTTTITMWERFAFKKCRDSLKKVLRNRPNNKLPKSQLILSRKKSSSFTIWMKAKSNLSEESIRETRFWAWERSTPMRRKTMIQSFSRNIKSCFKWKNKPISQSDRSNLRLLKNTRVSGTVFWQLTRHFMTRQGRSSSKIGTRLKNKLMRMTPMTIWNHSWKNVAFHQTRQSVTHQLLMRLKTRWWRRWNSELSPVLRLSRKGFKSSRTTLSNCNNNIRKSSNKRTKNN